MGPRLPGIALLLLCSLPLAALDDATLARRFAAAFETGNLDAFDGLAGEPISDPAWRDVTELLDLHHCVALQAISWRRTAHGLRVDTHGVGVGRRLSAKPHALRVTWVLTTDDARVRAAERIEKAIARAIADALPARKPLDPDTDREAVAVALAELAGTPDGPYTGRRDLLDEAMALAGGGRPSEAMALVTLHASWAAMLRGERDESLALVHDAVDRARAAGSADATAWALMRLGLRLPADQGLLLLHEVVGMIELLDDPRRALKAQTVVGAILHARTDLAATMREANKLLELSARYGWAEGELSASVLLADVHRMMGDADLAHAYDQATHRRATALRKHGLVAISLQRLASHRHALGENALDLYREVVALADRHRFEPIQRVWARTDLADALREAGLLDEATKVLEEASALVPSATDGPFAPVDLTLSLVRYDQRRCDEALVHALRALHAIEKRADFDVALARLAAGRALRCLGRSDEAMRQLQDAVALMDEWSAEAPGDAPERAASFSATADVHRALVELLVERGQIEEAFRVAGRMKGRELRAALLHGRVDLSAAMTDEEKKRERELERALGEWNRRLIHSGASPELLEALGRARREHRDFLRSLYVQKPQLRVRRVEDRLDDAPAIPQGITVVQFVVGTERTIAFVTAGGRMTAAVLPVTAAELKAAVDRVVRAVASRSLSWRDPAATLHAMLIAPLDLGDETTALCIIPDDLLWRVPFHVLAPPGGQPLGAMRPVFYATTVRGIEAGEPRRAGARLAAFGPPSLPGAEREVAAIARLYGTSASLTFTGNAATETAFHRIAPRADVIHVAAHGRLEDHAALHSALVLVPDETEDGLLEAREVMDLALDARLAVLAGCRTGEGTVRAGDGVLGLSWAFLAAGCPTIVVSQWAAETTAAEKLLVAFHGRLLAGAAPAAAMLHAQLVLMRDRRYAHPFYWAPFIVVGAGG